MKSQAPQLPIGGLVFAVRRGRFGLSFGLGCFSPTARVGGRRVCPSRPRCRAFVRIFPHVLADECLAFPHSNSGNAAPETAEVGSVLGGGPWSVWSGTDPKNVGVLLWVSWMEQGPDDTEIRRPRGRDDLYPTSVDAKSAWDPVSRLTFKIMVEKDIE